MSLLWSKQDVHLKNSVSTSKILSRGKTMTSKFHIFCQWFCWFRCLNKRTHWLKNVWWEYVLPLIIQERSKNEEQAYHNRQILNWDRDGRVEVSSVSISCGKGWREGLCCVDIAWFLKSHQNAQPTHPKLTLEN